MNLVCDFEEVVLSKWPVLTTMEQRQQAMLIALVGAYGELGEVSEPLKKFITRNMPIDRSQLAEEIGDVVHYLVVLCDTLDVSLDEVMWQHIQKVKNDDRYEVKR